MDSKLQKMAILVSMVVILLVSAAVIFSNTDWLERVMGSGIEAGNVTEGSHGQAENPEGYEKSPEELSAFETDGDFFDKEVKEEPDMRKRLSMMVTSVEKDLRIQVVDMDGQQVTGESFYVELESLGQYKDLDKDGIIYIGDLPAGEYYVKLQPMEGYLVPSNATKVRVKEKVEYVVIDDISLLILSEEDIDAAVEDTRVSEAVKESDQTEVTQMQKPSAGTKVGIDVSKWNGEIDWNKVKAAGVEFAIVRAGYRGSKTGSLVEDPYFKANMKGAAASGIPVGVYHYSYAKSADDARLEADFMLELISGKQFEYPVVFDIEDPGQEAYSNDVLTELTVAFCEKIEEAGYYISIYSNADWFTNKLDLERLKPYDKWLAHWVKSPKWDNSFGGLWQYTDSGRVDGIETKVDMNISYRDYPSIIKCAGLNGYGKKFVITATKKDVPSSETNALEKELYELGMMVVTKEED